MWSHLCLRKVRQRRGAHHAQGAAGEQGLGLENFRTVLMSQPGLV